MKQKKSSQEKDSVWERAVEPVSLNIKLMEPGDNPLNLSYEHAPSARLKVEGVAIGKNPENGQFRVYVVRGASGVMSVRFDLGDGK